MPPRPRPTTHQFPAAGKLVSLAPAALPAVSLVFIKIKNQFAASVYWSQRDRHRFLLGTPAAS